MEEKLRGGQGNIYSFVIFEAKVYQVFMFHYPTQSNEWQGKIAKQLGIKKKDKKFLLHGILCVTKKVSTFQSSHDFIPMYHH